MTPAQLEERLDQLLLHWEGECVEFKEANDNRCLPDFDLSDPQHVVLQLPGRFIDENYSRTLLSHADLPWPEVLALDTIQKGQLPDEGLIRELRIRGLIEGRRPNIHVAAEVAAATDTQTDYIRHRAFDDSYYCDLILKYLQKFDRGCRSDFERLLDGKFSDLLTEKQQRKKVQNLLQKLRRQGKIESYGQTRSTEWRLIKP